MLKQVRAGARAADFERDDRGEPESPLIQILVGVESWSLRGQVSEFDRMLSGLNRESPLCDICLFGQQPHPGHPQCICALFAQPKQSIQSQPVLATIQ